MPDGGRAAPSGVRFAVAVCFTLLWTTVLIAPASVKPLASVLAGAATGTAALIALAFTSRPLSREARLVLAAAGIGLVALMAGAIAQPAPLVSIFGVAGQHNGWLLWAVAALWFAVGAVHGRGTPVRAVIWSVGALGAAAGVFALLDAAHILESVRYSPEVAGLMESSISLGQVLLVGLGATAALVAMERSQGARLAAGSLFAVQAAALAVSGARGAQLVFAGAALVAALWILGGRLAPATRRVLWALVALVLAAAVVAVGAIAWLGPAAPGFIRTLLSDRPTIWHSALARVPDHLVLGEGPDRFTSIVDWSLDGGIIQWTSTNSPHDVLLDWLLGGGLPALAAFLAAFALAGRGIARRLVSSAPGPRLLALGAGAWAVSLLASWTDPLSAFTAALVVGALLSDGEVKSPATSVRTASVVAVVAAALAVLAVGMPLFGLERGWAAQPETGSADIATLESRWERWPDPSFGGDVLRVSLAEMPSSVATTGRLASEVLERTPWDANGVLVSVEVAVAVGRAQPSAPHPSLAQALAAGRAADPASPIWDRVQALVSGR